MSQDDPRDLPFARRGAPSGGSIPRLLCPFCGDSRLRFSFTDIPQDDQRLDLDCDNPDCDIRHFVVLDVTLPLVRADATALAAVDKPSEPSAGEPARVNPFEEMASHWTNSQERLARRRRRIKVSIEPAN